jgi:hypothetical protein
MSDTIVVIQENPPQVIVTAEQGPPGPQGAAGEPGSGGSVDTIVGISSTIAEFNAACSDADFATGGGTATGTNTGDNAVNSNYSSLETNATHTGDATGATALTVVGINGQNLAALATGILKNTTGTGIPSIAVAGDFPTLNQNTTGNAATASSISTPATFTGTALTDQPTLSEEFLDAAGWTSTGWTGDFTNGWTHTPGNTTVLSQSKLASNATKYKISYTVTGRTAGSITITFGGQSLSTITGAGVFGPTTTTTTALSITPTTDFNGTIIISIKELTAVSTPILQLNTAGNVTVTDIRYSLSSTNAFYGYEAGGYILNGVGCTGIGYQALKANTSGLDNTGVGYQALSATTTGASNTGIGSQALKLNTYGVANSACGYLSLGSNTTGSNNSGFGSSSLQSNTTGNNNTGIGRQALSANTAGINNTSVGYQSLIANVSGGNNTAVGTLSLFGITTGASNTAIGRNSGRFIADGSTANQTSTASCYFGAETRAGENANTNETVVGYQAIGAGSNTVRLGNVSVTKVQFSGNLEFDSATVSTISQVRQTIADTAGVNFTITPGGATVGATDKAGGQLILTGGPSTGTGESGITLQGYVAGSTGTADCSLQDMVKILGNKLAFNNATPVAKPTVTGSKVSGAALDSLLAALVSLGLITDSTSA